MDVSGVYGNVGEGYSHASLKRQRPFRPKLAGLLFSDFPVSPTEARQSQQVFATATEVELRQPSATQLDITVRHDPEVLATKTEAITVDPKTGAVSLPVREGVKTGPYAIAAYQTNRLTLFVGGDGWLYMEHHSGGAGVALPIVPAVISDTTWRRWQPAMRPSTPTVQR